MNWDDDDAGDECSSQSNTSQANGDRLSPILASDTVSCASDLLDSRSEKENEYEQVAEQRLCLASRGFTGELPSDEISEAMWVTDLDLSGNSFQMIGPQLAPFTSVVQLDLTSNQLDSIGEELGAMKQLRILFCKNNQLRTEGLPKCLSSMHSLEVINLSGNRLDGLPDQLIGLPRLTQLYLGGNQIERLSPLVRHMTSLQVLYLGGNKLRQVPEEIGELSRLRSLNLSDNQLCAVPQALSKLRRLQSLYLHANQIRTLPEEIIRLRRLSELSLRGNPLVVRFVNDFHCEPPTLLELAGRTIRLERVAYHQRLPKLLVQYLDSARECVNPSCRGVYFTSRVEHVKFVDFCGKFRVPLLQYLCSPRCETVPAHAHAAASSGSDDEEPIAGRSPDQADDSYLNRMMKKVLLG